jgi:assimilatory nitrate reductase catalytic subunit
MDVKTACPYCGVGCEIIVSRNGSNLTLKGDKESPVNQGMLCIKGQTLLETIGTDDERLLNPIVNNQESSWDNAVTNIANLLTTTPKDEIAFYLSGQMLMEDLFVAKKLTTALGIKNLESNSRLCMYSTVAANNRAYGADIVPVCYDDIYHADVVIIFGSNTKNCHPIVFNHIKKSKVFTVCIDVRETETSKHCDEFIQITNGTDLEIIENLEKYPWFKGKVLSIYSQGITQSTDGTNKVNALINKHIETKNINKRGCGVLSLTGQPDAMGAREIGIRTQDLAAPEFFSTSQIKTMWVMATNPKHSMINYRKIDNLIVSDFTQTLTSKDADIVLPATPWGERSGHQKNSERRYLKQSPFIPPAGNSKPDWQIICLVAQKLGLEGFDYQSIEEIWQEMDIDTTWQPQIKVRETPVELDLVEGRKYQPFKTNARLLTQWHTMSRTGKSKTLNEMTEVDDNAISIHHITNNELFEGIEVELDKHSKQPCFKGISSAVE